VHNVTRRSFPYRFALLAAFALFAVPWASVASARVGEARGIPPTQALAGLVTSHVAYAQPSTSATRVGMVQATRPITGEQTVLPVLATNGTWLKVRLPGRPNSHTGWIQSASTVAQTTSWHLVVKTASRRVLVYHSGHVVRTFTAIVGKPSTPTPHGEFFVEESIQLRPTDIGAPFALALSARSNVFQEFEGGPGQVALHGLDNVGGVLGTAASHGCVRLADDAMRWLVYRVGPGVPVTITS